MQLRQGLRDTRQRQVILEELGKVVSHPTADEVYRMVLRRLPHVSLGTVYRNLETLSGYGVIQKLELAGTQRRFDATTAHHYHLRCRICGRVDDLPMKPFVSIQRKAQKISAYDITGHILEFEGFCPKCKRRK